ncbi:hypothetical protein [Mesoterricola silvestris]|uniref:Uncharacterized protein n=1 Tax=Mesoterricola silvestris TaxID=2927979 RepID=A0AA48K886_9BACT|nr:hypothetical protein [Mesoterricola silvestris]BDU72679.1 hypothetical protein METEAL_18530 [Mesoterricola silvestris]
MPTPSRHLTRQSLTRALQAAKTSLGARTRALPPETQSLAQQCAEAIQARIQDLAEGKGPPAVIQKALTTLIHSHADPVLVGALREFAQILVLHLAEDRDRFLSRGKDRRDS